MFSHFQSSILKQCNTNMIMSYFSTIEMSYRKVVIILRFSGEYYDHRGHNHVKPKRAYKVAHSTEGTKQEVKSTLTTFR